MFHFDSGGMLEALKPPYLDQPPLSLLSHLTLAGSTVEAMGHREAAQAFLEGAVQEDVADRTETVEQLQWGLVVLALVGWDSQAGADHPALAGKVVAVQTDPKPDRNRA